MRGQQSPEAGPVCGEVLGELFPHQPGQPPAPQLCPHPEPNQHAAPGGLHSFLMYCCYSSQRCLDEQSPEARQLGVHCEDEADDGVVSVGEPGGQHRGQVVAPAPQLLTAG